ncbi:MAG: hypothetical protein HC933_11025 [Pleurocapsa sp. SU_196_0]|nr:hypothetical protein [Pleurocapsa sp. SU_196_0]
MYASLDQNSQNPAQDCQGLEAYLKSEANPKTLYPQEYQRVLSQQASPPVVKPQPAIPPVATNQPTPRVETVYTVAQLGVLLQNARQAKQSDEAAMRKLGTFHVVGNFEKYDPEDPDDVVFFRTLRAGFRSKVSVTCYDLSLSKLYNAGVRSGTLRGRFHDMTGSSIIQLEDCEFMSRATGLQPATLDDRAGLTRIQVKPAQVMTKPNEGLKMTQIEGLYWNAEGEWNIGGYQFVERTYLLLKDGWLYDNLNFTPADLNIAQSKKLEPQRWAQWKRQGKQILVQYRDDWGQPKGKPEVLDAELKIPMPRGARLDGVFQTSSSYTVGTSGNGASSTTQRSFRFLSGGTYEYNDFRITTASTSVGTGDGGSSGVAGGSSFGPNGTFSSGVGGGEDTGTYKIDGYTLELRGKKGQVSRAFAFLWDAKKYSGHLVINGTTYAKPEKK